MLASAKVELIVPVNIARLCSGTIVARITKPPAKMPDAPNPAIARPAISARDDGASPDNRLPIPRTKI